MSLNYDFSKVENVNEVFPPHGEYQNQTLSAMIWYCLFLDMSGINAKNVDEWFIRYQMYNKVFGAVYFTNHADGSQTPLVFDYQTVKNAIGLSVNVYETTHTAFKNKLLKNFERDCKLELYNQRGGK